jgi:hypothetical protein
MMDVLEFTKRIGEATDDPDVDRLAERFQEDLATFAVHLARYAGSLPEGLQSEYVELLLSTLNAVPSWTTIWVTPSLFVALRKLVPENGNMELLSKVQVRD